MVRRGIEYKVKCFQSITPSETKEHQKEEEEESLTKKTSKIIVSTKEVSFVIFRSILSFSSQEKENEESNIIKAITNIPKHKKWSFLLCHGLFTKSLNNEKGGHFSAAVFDHDQCIRHKSFHRYTVRK